MLYICFKEWLVTQTPVFGMKLPTGFQLIGQVVSMHIACSNRPKIILPVNQFCLLINRTTCLKLVELEISPIIAWQI